MITDRLSDKLGEATSLLKNTPFCRLWIAQSFALIAVYGISFGGVAQIEAQTQSTAQTGMVILSAILPAFLGALIAGPVVDRWDRVKVLITSHVIRALVYFLFWVGISFLPDRMMLWVVVLVNGLGTLVTQFATSAELALLPTLVGRPNLMSSNALLQLTMLVSEGIGIVVLAPLVIKLAGPPMIGVVATILCLLAFGIVIPLRKYGLSEPKEKPEEVFLTTVKDDLSAGWSAIARDRVLSHVAVQATIAATLLLVLLSLVPGMAARYLELAAEDTAFLIFPGGLGFVLGSFLISRWQGLTSRRGWIALGLVSFGASTGVLGLLLTNSEDGSVSLWLILMLIFCIGIGLSMVIIPARVVLQERPPVNVRGRVISAQLAMANAAALIPILVGGALADQLGIGQVMGMLGLLAAGSGIVDLRHVIS